MHEIETIGHNAFSLQPPLGCAEAVTFEVMYMLILSGQVSWQFGWDRLDQQEVLHILHNEGHACDAIGQFSSLSKLIPPGRPMMSYCVQLLPRSMHFDKINRNKLAYLVYNAMRALLQPSCNERMMLAIASESGHGVVTLRMMQMSKPRTIFTTDEFVYTVINYPDGTILGCVVNYCVVHMGRDALIELLKGLPLRVIPAILPSGFLSKTAFARLIGQRGDPQGIQYLRGRGERRQASTFYPTRVKQWLLEQFQVGRGNVEIRDEMETRFGLCKTINAIKMMKRQMQH